MTTQKDKEQEERFLKRTAEVFEESVQSLDAETRSRLNRGRQRALEAAAGPAADRVSVWLPAAGVAAAAVAGLLVWSGQAPEPGTPAPEEMASDFELLLEAEDLEMLQDLEFYSWIDLDDVNGAADDNVG